MHIYKMGKNDSLFANKFHSLNSQDHELEEIIWSSSESNDTEVVKSNQYNVIKTQKRKRKRKKTAPKNISNLDIAIIDVPSDDKVTSNVNKSPILNKHRKNKASATSPILKSSPQYLPPSKCSRMSCRSPVLASKQQNHLEIHEKSPILKQKYGSPKQSPSVRKKLFKIEKRVEINNQSYKENNGSTSPILNETKNIQLDRRKCNKTSDNHKSNCDLNIKNNSNIFKNFNQSSTSNVKSNENHKQSISLNKEVEKQTSESKDFDKSGVEYSSKELNESNEWLKIPNSDLVRKVKSYFDSNFSSENGSQHSISDFQTPQENTESKSDDIEISNSMTQVILNNSNSSIKQEPSMKTSPPADSVESCTDIKNNKKIRHKKGGLAYRLSALLKKQNASVSLWQHERFLAENSNFVIPKEEHLVFRIRNVHFKYGCYLLEVMDVNDIEFLILINGVNIHNNYLFNKDAIFKLYKPYKILDYNDRYKLIINVCKYECIRLKLNIM